MVIVVIEAVTEADIVVALGGMTMDTGGHQGGPHHHIGEEVVITLLLQGGPHRHIEVVGVTTHHLGAHLTMVADQGGNGQDLLHTLLLTGVLKGTILVAERLVFSDGLLKTDPKICCEK